MAVPMTILLPQDQLHVVLKEANNSALRFLRKGQLHADGVADVRQDVLVDFFERLEAFDASRGSMGAFANVVMSNRTRRLAQQLLAYRRMFGWPPVSIDDPLSRVGRAIVELVTDSDGYSGMMGHHTDPFAAVERYLDVETMLSVLPERDAEFCRRLMSPAVIGLFPHGLMPRATAYRRLARIRRLLVANGFGARDGFPQRRVEVFMGDFASTVPVVGDGSTSDEFKTWLADAKPGAVFVYHSGSVALATDRHGQALRCAERQKLARLAHRAWLAAAQGRVHLLQRRLGENCFEYFAVARLQTGEPDHIEGGRYDGR
jgi:RNA polymerase sigma-70 factor (ECF subfamily)